MVVEDDADVRETIAEVVALDGHAVVAVENGEQAVGVLAVSKPLAVFSDLRMPIRDGHGLIAHMRAHARTRSIPICVISSESGTAPADTTVFVEAVRHPGAAPYRSSPARSLTATAA
jgi:CheY-like chemotaxis protein